jgi:hypothetical protein
MPVTWDKVNTGLGADEDVRPLRSSNPRSLPRVQECPTIRDLGIGDMDMAAEAACLWVKPLHCLADAGHSLPMALSQQAMSLPPHPREEGRGISPQHRVVGSKCNHTPI